MTTVLILTSLKLWHDHASGTTMLAIMFAWAALVSACCPYAVQPFVQGYITNSVLMDYLYIYNIIDYIKEREYVK